MAEVNCPQVFVADQPTSSAQQRPVKQKSLWKRAQKSLLLPLFAIVMCGLVLEGIFIYRLHKRTEMLFLSQSLLPNQSSLHPPDGNALGRASPIDSNKIPTGLLPPQELKERPMAHLRGSDNISADGVVQWVKDTESFASHMGYNSSGLVIKTEGFYYLYSKVHFSDWKECEMVMHRVVKNTTNYLQPIDLMRSKSYRCPNESRNKKSPKKDSDLWNSFLAGTFHLESGAHIYVILDKRLSIGPHDNFFGAFKIS